MKQLKGLAVSPGIAIAKAYHVAVPDFSVEHRKSTHIDYELRRLDHAFHVSKQELLLIREKSTEGMKRETAAIFDVHLLILNDEELIQEIKKKIRDAGLTAEAALEEVTASFIHHFDTMDNPYMRERIYDIRDVLERVLSHLLHLPTTSSLQLEEEIILIAHDIHPSTLAQLSNEFVKGIITEVGGIHSHASIIARSLNIPYVVGIRNLSADLASGDLVIIDGEAGSVVLHPDEATIASYKERSKSLQKVEVPDRKGIDTVSTKDSVPIKLAANISFPEDVIRAKEAGAKRIGLYRTEFLYMDKPTLPTEEEQYETYATVLKEMNGDPVTIRTLDIGADKILRGYPLPEQLNPALGMQSIRFCLENKHIFRPQLRALLRASVHGNLKIMFPMIATLEEIREAKALLAEEKAVLEKEQIPVADTIEIGVMIEVPSAAMIAPQLAKEVDFFSIGTNDLIQYTMAADRLNESVAATYQQFHPAVLQLLSHVIEAGESEGIAVSVCGEMAADPIARPILLAVGLRKFSMEPSFLNEAQTQLQQLSVKKLTSFKDELLRMGTAKEVVTLLESIRANDDSL